MDLLDFQAQDLYFEQQESAAVSALLQQASLSYAQGEAEMPLLKAYFLAPHSLNVLVALNRFYYHQHRLDDALQATDKALSIVATQLNFPLQWQDLTPQHLTALAPEQLTQLRLYLFVLKSRGFLNMRLQHLALSACIFEKVLELDVKDRIGAAGLLELVKKRIAEDG